MVTTKKKASLEGLAGDKYLRLVEHAADGIAIIQDGVLKLVNTALSGICGYDKEELLGMPFTKLLTPESQKLTLARYQTRMAGKKVPPIYEIKALIKNGETRDIEINAALTEYDGRPADEVIIRDITERKRIDEALQAEKNKLQSVIDSLECGLTIQDKDYNIIYHNEVVKSYFGDQIGNKCYRAYENNDDVCLGCPVAEAFKDGQSHTAERKVVTPSGEVTFWENTANPIRDAQGNIVSCLEITRNITERKKAEQALADEATWRRILIDQSRDGIVVLDQDGKVYEANRRFAEMLGYTPEETAELHVWDWEYLYPREQVLEMIRTVDEAGDHFETQHRRKDGSVYDVEISTNGAMFAGQKLIFCVCRDITERKKAEQALRENEEQYRDLFENANDLIQAVKTDGHFLYVNTAWRKELGYSDEEIANLRLVDIIHPHYKKKCVEIFQRVISGEKIKNIEVVFVTKDGRAITLEGNASCRFEGGKPVNTRGIFRNITSRKQAEDALRESEERYRTVIEGAHDMIQSVALDGSINFVNQAWLDTLGYNQADLPKLNLFKVIHPDSLPHCQELFARVIEGEPVHNVQATFLTKDGRKILVEGSAAPRFIGDKVVATQGIFRDITERKQMEQQLQEKNEQLDAQNEELRAINEELRATEEELQHSQERLERMFESVTDGIVVTTLEGIVLKVNERAAQMIGYASGDELLGKSCFDCVVQSDHNKMADNMQKVIKEGLIRSQEYTLRKADGTEFPAELSTNVIKDASGNVRGLITISRDITERRQAEEREKQLEQELNLAGRLASIGQLAAGVAHEINNPLTGVIGFSHLLLSRDIPDDIKQDLQVIHSEAQRVAKIVENLLVFAHQRKTGREHVNINEIINRVLELRAYEMKVNNIKVEAQLAPELPLTIADAGQLQQVFLNIVLNAEHFITKAHNRGKLIVKTEEVNGSIRASFTDDGTGVSPENLDKIFNPFFTTKEVGKGTGLGLSICHSIITQHQGRIYARSKLGKGATFVIELPVVADTVQTGKAEETRKEPQKSRGAKILVVDDEKAILTFLSRLLTAWGHSVETINNADATLERLKTKRYSLILLDIKLPGMSGIELYHHIEKTVPALTRRVMFITGDVMEGTTREFLEKSKAAHITKPIDIEVLKKMINRALNQTPAAPVAMG